MAAITPLAQQLKARLLAHEAKIGIIGLGYVGLPLALLDSGASFRVSGFDIDDKKR
jgi:UDP-N-acetyl-D-glucosamine dehydrogenase